MSLWWLLETVALGNWRDLTLPRPPSSHSCPGSAAPGLSSGLMMLSSTFVLWMCKFSGQFLAIRKLQLAHGERFSACV